MEGSEQEEVTVNCQDGGAPKMGEISAKVGGPFEKGHCRFWVFVWKRAFFVWKKAIVKIYDLKKFHKHPKWEVCMNGGVWTRGCDSELSGWWISQSGREITQSGRSIWKRPLSILIFGLKRAYYNKKNIIVDFEVHLKKAILKKFQKLTKWKVLRGQRGLNERTWWWIVRTVDLQEWERNHQKWEVHLKKVIVDFDYSFKKRHTSFKKSHCRFCGPFEKAIVDLIFLKKSA